MATPRPRTRDQSTNRNRTSWRASFFGWFGLRRVSTPSPAPPPPPYSSDNGGYEENMGARDRSTLYSISYPDEKRQSLLNLDSPSQARIQVINETTGQVLGYMAQRAVRGCCYNVQMSSKGIIFEIQGSQNGSSSSSSNNGLFRLKLAKPSQDAGDYPYMGIQIAHDEDGSNERWNLRACDAGKPGAVFKGRSGVFPCTRFPGLGEVTSAMVWSVKRIDATTEELVMQWPDDNGALVPVQAVFDKTAMKYYPRVYGRPVEHQLTANEQKVKLILERYSPST